MLKWIFIAPIAAFSVIFMIVFINELAKPQENTADRIERLCTEQFSIEGGEAIARCRLAASVVYLRDKQNQKLQAVFGQLR